MMHDNKKEYTWDDLYERAIGCAFLSDELNAKDNARYELQNLILSEDGYDIEKCECPEDEIDSFLFKREMPVLFNENGNLIRK